jgi:oligoendopeptidase F
MGEERDAVGIEPGRWSLDDLLSSVDGPEFESILAQLEEAMRALEAARPVLTADLPLDRFKEIVARIEDGATLSRRLRAYAGLWFAEDTRSQAALAFQGRVEKVLTQIRNRTLFLELWWKGLPDEAVARLLPACGDATYYFQVLRRYVPHTLSEPEERVINLKNPNGAGALVTLYQMLTNRFTFHLKLNGHTETLGRAGLMAYATDPSAGHRAAAYQELYRVYGESGTILGQIYQHVVRDWADEQMTLRGFSSPIAPRNLGNDVPDEAVDTLLAVCRENVGLFQSYFRLKAGALGSVSLRRYDLYAPLGSSTRTVPFGAALERIDASLRAFSPRLADEARRVLDAGHLDAEVRPGKVSGAFCYGVEPELVPWVLTNYVGKEDSVFTLAHELGHAVHALLAADHSTLTFHSALPLAETASVFAEILLLEHALSQEVDPDVKRDLLVQFIDGAYATVLRQAYFVLFEKEAHALIRRGVTTDALAKRYLANLAEQFGDAVEVAEEFRWEWISIPHIYETPFYCYAYSFGQLLVLALYRRYLEEGAAFVPKYLRILSYGGSKAPAEILREAQIDIADKRFWQGGFDVLAEMIADLDALQRSIAANRT